jgi:glycine cleavage system aminomethyltransferase T
VIIIKTKVNPIVPNNLKFTQDSSACCALWHNCTAVVVTQSNSVNSIFLSNVVVAKLYSCMLNETGGVVDDLIVYYQNENDYRMVINAGTTDKDIAWIKAQAQGFEVCVEPKFDLAMIAVQGPNAREKVYIIDNQIVYHAARFIKHTTVKCLALCF